MDPMSIIMLLVVIAIPVLIVLLIVQSKRNSNTGLPVSEKYNTLAVVAFILAFFVSIAAVVLGHIALSQIKRTNERGWGLAVAALCLGYAGLLAGAIWVFVVITQLAAI